uniref:FRA10A associated CGG repeat 1 n=1 Tax=Astatotilapia calliptera TaxID=8154 RepID=A0AAX7UE81_ASTCA
MDDLVKVHGGGGYDSDFSDEDGQGESSQRGLKRKHEEEILQKPFQKGRHSKVAHRSLHSNEVDREEARNRRAHLISMNAFERHKKFVGDYILYYGGQMVDFKRSVAKDKTDLDVLRENHRFLWRDEDEEDMTWRKEVKAKPKTEMLLDQNQKPAKAKAKKKKRSSSHSKKHKHKKHRDRSTSSSSSEELQNSDKDSDAGDEPEDQSEGDHWRGPAPAVEEKSREEEFDEYFEDMFL